MNADLFISRKRRWELAAQDAALTATRDAMIGAAYLMILAVLLAVYLT